MAEQKGKEIPILPQLSSESLYEALRQVKDPELDRDLVSLGMVQNLREENGTVSLELALTSPRCPMREQIEADVRKTLGAIPGVREVRVQVRVMTEEESKRHQPAAEGGTSLPFNRVRRVGKSLVTSLLAVALRDAGNRVGILDADITGPSIPRLFGLHGEPDTCAYGILPAQSRRGIKVISMNLFLQREGQAVIWRGPLIAGAIQQFWGDVLWGQLDYLLIDLPPG
ncbi:MAG: P-loop NTPase, partial [Coprothermobacterota bacterium]|nr:P-loop NTPase [Coprothermobacterota bacterium]